jgi:hypothetical protein
MLLNVAVHNVSIRNVKVSKRKRHRTYGVTEHTASQIVRRHKSYSAQNVNVKKHKRQKT